MKKLFILTALVLVSTSLLAQDTILRADLEARIDYMQEYIDSENVSSGSGFKGRYLLLRLDGQIAEGFSYSLRQRINKPASNSSLFDATDWLTLTYAKEPWSISAGKQVVAIGGYEYDRSPVDLFFCSEYWNNIPCFQFGVSGSYSFRNDKLTFQVSESPFRRSVLNPQDRNMLAYNLMWNGSHDWFKSIYSVNMIEYMPGKYINYIVLGNTFAFGEFALELDIMNRASSVEELWCTDYSVIGELSWNPIDALKVFIKATYDRNTTVAGDLCVSPGTELVRAGAGIEYFPLKNKKNLRLHLNCCYTDGDSPAANVLKEEQTIIDAGITWKMNFLNIKRR